MYRGLKGSALATVRKALRKNLSARYREFAVCPTVFLIWHTERVARRLEERIQQLCSQVVATHDDEELSRLCVELRNALNEHIGQLRDEVDQYRNSLNQAPKKGEVGDVG